MEKRELHLPKRLRLHPPRVSGPIERGFARIVRRASRIRLNVGHGVGVDDETLGADRFVVEIPDHAHRANDVEGSQGQFSVGCGHGVDLDDLKVRGSAREVEDLRRPLNQ